MNLNKKLFIDVDQIYIYLIRSRVFFYFFIQIFMNLCIDY